MNPKKLTQMKEKSLNLDRATFKPIFSQENSEMFDFSKLRDGGDQNDISVAKHCSDFVRDFGTSQLIPKRLNDRTENRSGVGIDETRSRVRCSEFHRFGVL